MKRTKAQRHNLHIFGAQKVNCTCTRVCRTASVLFSAPKLMYMYSGTLFIQWPVFVNDSHVSHHHVSHLLYHAIIDRMVQKVFIEVA